MTVVEYIIGAPTICPSCSVGSLNASQSDNETIINPELVRFLNDLSRIEAGALVLFTSREQMRQAVDALSTSMRNQVLVQTFEAEWGRVHQ